MGRMNVSVGITPDNGERVAVFGDWSLYQTGDANGWLALKLVFDGGAKLAKAIASRASSLGSRKPTTRSTAFLSTSRRRCSSGTRARRNRPKYFDIACRRIEDAQRQQRLFA